MVAILGYDRNEIVVAVRAMYSAVAEAPEGGFHFPVGRQACRLVGYPEEVLDALPERAVASFAGVGYPFAAEVIRPGDVVLDIGSGSGTDTLIASRLVGENGHVWALDITPAMAAKLRATLEAEGIANVQVIEGSAEAIPLPDASVDVVTSNGVLNLVPDKRQAFAEIARVLKPGGRVQIADIVVARPVSDSARSDPQLWAECVVGAAVDEDYLALQRQAGLGDVAIRRERDYFAASPSADTRRIAESLGARAVEIVARRPAEGAASRPRGPAEGWQPRRLKAVGERGLWGAFAATGALLACYGMAGAFAALALLGWAVPLDPGIWAAMIAILSVLVVVGIGLNVRRHRRPWPLIVALPGAALVLYAMFGRYDPVLEAAGFAILIAAVGFDLYVLHRGNFRRSDTSLGPSSE